MKISFDTRIDEETNNKSWNTWITFKGDVYNLSLGLNLYDPWWGLINHKNEEDDYEANETIESRIVGINLYFISFCLGKWTYYELENN